MNDPIQLLARRLLFVRIAAGVLMVAGVAWVFMPSSVEPAMTQPQSVDKLVGKVQETAPTRSETLDAGGFEVRLWNAPPEQRLTRTEIPESPPGPPNVSLVGIISESGTLHAALYDITADKLLVLQQGQTIQRFTVQEISIEKVILSDGPQRHELRLRESAS
jgi:hypothetical protein